MLKLNNTLKATAVCLTASLLVACDSNDKPMVVTADTDLLVRNAAELSSRNLGTNLTGIESTANSSMAIKSLVEKRAPGLAKHLNKQIVTATRKTDATGHEKTILDNILPTLEGGNATRERNGNTVTIDPDESFICRQWLNEQGSESLYECTELLSELSVRIDATSDETGTLNYLFSNQDLLAIQYAPTEASYELYLPGVKTALQRLTSVTGEQINYPEVMQGAVKLTAQAHNTTPGAESGRIALNVTQPLDISSNTPNYSFNLGTSTLFDVTANASTGNGSVAINVNNMNLAIEGLIGATDSAITRFNLPSFTLNANINRSGTEVNFSNFGLGQGPFTLKVDNFEVIRVGLETFSAQYNDLTRNLEFFENLYFEVLFDHSSSAFGWFADNSVIQLNVSTSAGTILQQQDNASVKVEQGGPLNFDYNYTDPTESIQVNNSFSDGECFADSIENEGFDLVSCNQ